MGGFFPIPLNSFLCLFSLLVWLSLAHAGGLVFEGELRGRKYILLECSSVFWHQMPS